MSTMFRQGQTTYIREDFSTNGTAVESSVIRDLTKFMDNPERRDTPFLNIIGKGSAVSQIKHEWGLRAVKGRGSTVAGGGIDADDTALTVASGTGARFQQGHVLLIHADGDPYTFEHVWVQAVSSDSLTIVREQGGTTGTIFAAGSVIKIIGIAMPELTAYPIGPSIRGDLFYNYPQRFMTKVQVDVARENTPDYENNGSWLNYDAATRSADLKIDLEMAVIHGRRQLGDPDASPAIPYMMSGALHFAELGGNTYDLDGALLEVDHIEEADSDLFDLVGSMKGHDLAMSNSTARIFDRIISIDRYATASETVANLTWKTVKFRNGDYTFTAYPNIPDGHILIFNRQYTKRMPYRGMDWQSSDRGEEELGMPAVERQILGQFTMEVQAPLTSALITGFETDLTAYPKLVS